MSVNKQNRFVKLKNMENTKSGQIIQRLYVELKKTQFSSRKDYSSDAVEAEQQVNNEHFKTLIEHLDNNIAACTDKDNEYVKIIAMKASLLYQQSKILMLLENFQAAKGVLQDALSLIQGFVKHSQVAYLYMRLINHLAYLFSKEGNFEESKKLLESAGDYSELEDLLIYNTDNIFGIGDLNKTEDKSRLNMIVATNLQMLAWIYGKLGQPVIHAAKQHLSLRKQLEVKNFDPFNWTYKCIQLASLYLAGCNWNSACYHLVAAEVVLRRFEGGNHKQLDFPRACWGDLAKAWIKYGLHLFGTSKLLFADRPDPENSTPSEPTEQDLLFFNLEINTSGIPKRCIRNYEEARSLFLHTHNWLNKAKVYYNFPDYPTYYVNIILDLSELLRLMAFYEQDLDSQYNTHKKRADALETLCSILKAVKPQCYAAVSVELLRELSEIQIEMMSINLRRLHMGGSDCVDANDNMKKRISAIASVRMKLGNIAVGGGGETNARNSSQNFSDLEFITRN